VPAPAGHRSFSDLAFVGREGELARLRAAVAGFGVVTLAGPAGVGKSRLIAELVRDSPLPVIEARAFRPERAEAWGLARSVLREALAVDAAVADRLPPRVRDALAALLPELSDGPGLTLDGESRRALLLAGGLRVVEAATGDGALLVVDDLQWADPSSVVLLGSVLARLPSLAAVLAFRPDELPAGALAELHGARGGVEVVLGPLPVEAVEGLVGHPDLAQAVLRATDRTPFAIAELLRELALRDVLTATPGGGGWTPRSPNAIALAVELGRAGQRRAVQRRAERQTGPRAEVLGLLALLAREAPASTVAAAAGLDGRAALEVLSGLAAVGLLRLGEQGWATAHDLVAETVTAGLGDGDRGRLHGLLAGALEAEDADPSEIARHHHGAGDAAAAARTFVRAAERALHAHATREAAALAEAGLALDPRAPVRAELLTVRAEAGAVHGDPAAITDLRAALAVTDDGATRSRRLSRLAMLTFGAQDPLRASELVELALVEAGNDDAAQALALETAAILDMNLDRPARAGERAESALALYRRLGEARGVARILDGRAMATFLDGRITEGVEVFGRVARLFTDSGELLRVVTPRSTRGHGLVFMGRPAEGLAEASAALALARDLGAPDNQAYALWHRSEALSGLGRADEAEVDAWEALTIAHSLGHRGWTATAHRARGIALTARRELDDAAAAFAESSAAAGESLTLFAAWAAGQAALVALARGEVRGVDVMVARALSLGPPLGHYEARLAQVELLAAGHDPTTPERAAVALVMARDAGHIVSANRLAELSEQPDHGPG
jgi:tetratricopeptide (TPR) repeat protein